MPPLEHNRLFIISMEDVDAVIGERELTDEQRDACYEAVRMMDSSLVFEQIEQLIDECYT